MKAYRWLLPLWAASLLPTGAAFAIGGIAKAAIGRIGLTGLTRLPLSQRIIGSKSQTEVAKQLPACDYLVIGGGATGMAFVDSLLHHHSGNPSVVMVDKHQGPGGHWHDSYPFVRLHQPSAMYGVESEKLEGGENAASHRATRDEILDYYARVQQKLEQRFDFKFYGGVEFDFASSPAEALYVLRSDSGDAVQIKAKKVVDARFLEPDLPVFVGPRFRFDPDATNVVPVNALADSAQKEMIGDEGLSEAGDSPVDVKSGTMKYVVIGAGKTGMDACVYLQTAKGVDPEDILWVMPHDAWITARENIASCMEFLSTCVNEAKLGSSQGRSPAALVALDDFLQKGFLKLEKEGKVYRFSDEILPSRFKDATLCKRELALLKRVTNVVRGARVEEICADGSMRLAGGSVVTLPWTAALSSDAERAEFARSSTTFVHCSAGAFNYHKLLGKQFPPLFAPSKITIQDVYGTPGFCFVGSLVGKLEALGDALSDDAKNAMCRTPLPSPHDSSVLGPSGGDIGTLSSEHGLVQRLANLRSWYSAGLGDWLHGDGGGGGSGHRLFNLAHMDRSQAEAMVDEAFDFLQKAELVER